MPKVKTTPSSSRKRQAVERPVVKLERPTTESNVQQDSHTFFDGSNFRWTIKDFKKRLEESHQTPIESEVFTAGGVKWFLEMYLSEDDPIWISVYVQLASSQAGTASIRTYCSLTMVSAEARSDYYPTHNYPNGFDISKQCGWGTGRFATVKEADERAASDGSMSILCDIQLARPSSSAKSKDQRRSIATDHDVVQLASKQVEEWGFRWVIADFMQRYEGLQEEHLYSQEFRTGAATKWLMALSPWTENANWMAVDLHLAADQQQAVHAYCKVSLVDTNGFVSQSYYEHNFPDGFRFNNFCDRGFGRFVTWANAVQHVDSKGTLTLYCQIQLITKHVDLQAKFGLGSTAALPAWSPTHDCVFVAGDRRFLLHRTVLAQRCPLLANLLPPGVGGADATLVAGLSREVFGKLCQFIYTGQAVELDNAETVVELRAAAQRFQLPELEILCQLPENAVEPPLTQSDAVARLIAADQAGDERRKSLVVDFMVRHKRQMFDVCAQLASSHPQLFRDLLLKMVN